MASQSVESMMMCTKSENNDQESQQDMKKPRPADELSLKCPRCDSANTKFCYYNNYSLTQPRYFCKSCRRYWTKGGTLRNVPVGGGCRKNKRPSSLSKRTTPDSHLQLPDHITPLCSPYDHNLALSHPNISILANHGNTHFDLFGNPSGNSFLDTLRSGFVENNHFMYHANNLGDVNHEQHHRMAMQFDDLNNKPEIMSNGSSGSSTPTKNQEMGENRILWGFPWQLNGEENYINGGSNEINLLKEGWNSALVGSTWNNLVNSPLM